MSCIITYKGKQYSEENFKEYFINNKQEFATSITKNKDVINSFKIKMEAIDGVFKDSPEQIHILGSQQDIEGFKKFTNNSEETIETVEDPSITEYNLSELDIKNPKLEITRDGVTSVIKMTNTNNLLSIDDIGDLPGVDLKNALEYLYNQTVATDYQVVISSDAKAFDTDILDQLVKTKKGFYQNQVFVLHNTNNITNDYYNHIKNLNNNDLDNNDKSKFSTNIDETIADADEKINMLQKAIPNATIIYDSEMDELGVVLNQNSKEYKDLAKEYNTSGPIIKVNPNKFKTDTIIHEFAHILIESYDKSIVNKLINDLKNSELWDEVKANYQELTEEELGKEVLATAIGLSGAELFDKLKDETLLESILRRLQLFLVRLGRYLGIAPNSVAALASDLLYNNVKLSESPFFGKNIYSKGGSFSSANNILDHYRKNVKLIHNKIDHYYQVTLKDGSVVDKNTITSGTEYIKKVFPETNYTEIHQSKRALRKILTDPVDIAKYLDKTLSDIAFKRNLDELLNSNKTFEVLFNSTIKDLNEDDEYKASSGTEFHAVLDKIVNLAKDKKPFDIIGLKVSTQEEEDLKIIYNIAQNAVKKGSRIETELSVYDQANNIAGTIDLLILDKTGKAYIYDYKTYSSGYKAATDVNIFNNYVKTRGVKNAAQLLLYKNILQKHGIQVAGINNIVFQRKIDSAGIITGHRMLKTGTVNNPNPMYFDALSLTNSKQTFVGFTSKDINEVLEIKLKIKDYNNLDSQTKIVNRILGELNIRRNYLALELKKNPTNKGLSFLLRSVEDNILNISKLDKQVSIGKFLNFTSGRIKSIDKTIKKHYDNPVVLADTKRELGTYARLLSDIATEESKIIESYNPLGMLSEVNRVLNEVNDKIIEKSARILAEHSGIGQGYYKILYQNEFIKNNRIETESGKSIALKQSVRAIGDFIQIPTKFFARVIGTEGNVFKNIKTEGVGYYLGDNKVSRDQHTAEMNKYVNNKLNENKDLVDRYTYKAALTYLEHTPHITDSVFYATADHINDPRSAQDYRIRSIIALSDKYASENNQKFLEKEIKLKKIAEKLNNGFFSSEKMYEKFIDKNGHMISEYKSEFIDTFYASKDKERWLDENTTTNIINNKPVITPTAKWKNPEYNGVKDDLLYKEFIQIYHDILDVNHNNRNMTRRIYHQGAKLNLSTPFYKLPSVLSSITDSIVDESGSIKAVLLNIKESFSHNANDKVINKYALSSGVSRSKYQTAKDIANRLLQKHAIDKTYNKDSDYTKYNNTKHFTKKLNEDRKIHNQLVSKNILKSLLMDYHDALDFSYTENVKHDAEVLRQSGLINSYNKSNIGVLRGDDDLSLGDYKNTTNFKRLENIIAQKIYRVKPGNDVKGIFVPMYKGFDKLLTWTYMSLNYISNAMNYYMGTTDAKIMAVGSGVYNSENYENSKKITNRSSRSEIADAFRYEKRALSTLLLKEHGLDETFNEDYKNKSLFKNVLKRINPTSFFFDLDNIAKHYVNSSILISIMDTYKALDANGDYITKDGKSSKDVKDAVGIQNFYKKHVKVLVNGVEQEMIEDKVTNEKVISEVYLKLDSIVKNTNKASLENLNNKIRGTTINLVRLATGNYEQGNKSMLGSSVFGMIFEKFRLWIAPGLESRFAGWSNITKPAYSEFSESQIFYDSYLDGAKDGYYTTAIKFLLYNNATKNNLLIRLLSSKLSDTEYNKNFSDLDQNELDNIKRVYYEIVMMSLALLTASILKAMGDDDDDDEVPYQLVVLYRRLYMERASLTPTPMGFWEMFKVLRDPMPGANWIGDIVKLMDYVWVDDDDFYKTDGKEHHEKGEWKGYNQIKKMIPGYRMWNKDLKNYLKQLENPQ